MPVQVNVEDEGSNGEDPIKESVAVSSVTVIAQPAMLSNLAYSNTVANTNLASTNTVAMQQALNQLSLAVTGKTVQSVLELQPLEAQSVVEVLTGDTTAEDLIDDSAAAGGGSGPRPPIPPPPDGIVLPANPAGPPYQAETPTTLNILNVADAASLRATERTETGRWILEITSVKLEPVQGPTTPLNLIPMPISAGKAVSANVPLLLSYPNRVRFRIAGNQVTIEGR